MHMYMCRLSNDNDMRAMSYLNDNAGRVVRSKHRKGPAFFVRFARSLNNCTSNSIRRRSANIVHAHNLSRVHVCICVSIYYKYLCAGRAERVHSFYIYGHDGRICNAQGFPLAGCRLKCTCTHLHDILVYVYIEIGDIFTHSRANWIVV